MPSSYEQDKIGKWYYVTRSSKGKVARKRSAEIRRCDLCGKEFPMIVRRKTRHCSFSCAQKNTSPSGSDHPSWKGGRIVQKDGYVIVYAPDHPASNIGKNHAYVKEHRLVMEQMIGRFLYPWESVHHKDGNPSNNNPENLELWTTAQPAGQRYQDLPIPHCPTCTCKSKSKG